MIVRAREQIKGVLELQCFSFPAPNNVLQDPAHYPPYKQLNANRQQTKENLGKTISHLENSSLDWSVCG